MRSSTRARASEREGRNPAFRKARTGTLEQFSKFVGRPKIRKLRKTCENIKNIAKHRKTIVIPRLILHGGGGPIPPKRSASFANGRGFVCLSHRTVGTFCSVSVLRLQISPYHWQALVLNTKNRKFEQKQKRKLRIKTDCLISG